MSPINLLPKQPINWSALMEQYEHGELDQKQFCQANNISVLQFKYYRKKLKGKSTPAPQATLVPIMLKANPTQEQRISPHFQLIFQNGIHCQLPMDFNSKGLKQLIEVLQSC